MTLAFNIKKESKLNIVTAAILLALCVVMVLVLKAQFQTMEKKDTIYYGKNENVYAIHRLSEWNENLATTRGGAGDALVYEIRAEGWESEADGDTLVILGGVHANEPAGVLTATYLVENLHPTAGRVFVLTNTNEAGYTCTDPQEASPMFYTIDTGSGERTFRFGSRVTNPIYQWPDPDIYAKVYTTNTEGDLVQKLAGAETRNLNRCYPGVADGTITEQVAYALTQMVRDVDACMEIDMHEASPEYQTINTTVAESRAATMVASALMWYKDDNFAMNTETSPTNFRGLSHIEMGENTDAFALLMETSNPSQGREHGLTGSDLVVTGYDKFYKINNESVGIEDKEYGVAGTDGENGRPISQRVARHMTAINFFVQGYADTVKTALETGTADAYEDAGIGVSKVTDETYKYYGQTIADRRTGILDLGTIASYDELRDPDSFYKLLAPGDIETSSDHIWELWEEDVTQFPIIVQK